MNYEKVEPARDDSMSKFPDTDTLCQFEDGTFIRLRITAKTTEGEVRDAAPQPGVNETIYLKLQCSLAKDGSGDVREDAAGNHLLLAAEVHGISAETLVGGGASFDAWLADRTDEILQKAKRKAYVLDQVLARFRFESA